MPEEPTIGKKTPALTGPLILVALITLGWFIFYIREILVSVLMACVLAAALYPPVQWLETRHWPKRLSISVFYLLFLLIAAGTLALTLDALIDQGRTLIQVLPVYSTSWLEALEQLPFFEGSEPMLRQITNNIQALTSQAFQVVLSTLNYLNLFFHSVANVIVILVLGFFLLADTAYFHKAVLKLFPDYAHPTVSSLLRRLSVKIGCYVRGKLIIMTLVGGLVWLGLLLLGIPYAVLLGLISFILEIIPMLGPILASFFGLLVTLGYDPSMIPWVLVLYFVIQQLESYFLTPKILGESVGLHPAWVLISVLIGAILIGVPGVLLSVPIAVLVSLLWEEFYLKGFIARLEDRHRRGTQQT